MEHGIVSKVPTVFITGADSLVFDFCGTYTVVDNGSTPMPLPRQVKIDCALNSAPTANSNANLLRQNENRLVPVVGSVVGEEVKKKLKNLGIEPVTLKQTPSYDGYVLHKNNRDGQLEVVVLDGGLEPSLEALQKALDKGDLEALDGLAMKHGMIFALVWFPAKKTDTLKRILYTGSASAERVVAALEKASSLTIFQATSISSGQAAAGVQLPSRVRSSLTTNRSSMGSSVGKPVNPRTAVPPKTTATNRPSFDARATSSKMAVTATAAPASSKTSSLPPKNAPAPGSKRNASTASALSRAAIPHKSTASNRPSFGTMSAASKPSSAASVRRPPTVTSASSARRPPTVTSATSRTSSLPPKNAPATKRASDVHPTSSRIFIPPKITTRRAAGTEGAATKAAANSRSAVSSTRRPSTAAPTTSRTSALPSNGSTLKPKNNTTAVPQKSNPESPPTTSRRELLETFGLRLGGTSNSSDVAKSNKKPAAVEQVIAPSVVVKEEVMSPVAREIPVITLTDSPFIPQVPVVTLDDTADESTATVEVKQETQSTASSSTQSALADSIPGVCVIPATPEPASVSDSEQIPSPIAVSETNSEREASITDRVVSGENEDCRLDVDEEPRINPNTPPLIPVMEVTYKPEEHTENGDISVKSVSEAESEVPPGAPVEEVNNVHEPVEVSAQPESSDNSDVTAELTKGGRSAEEDSPIVSKIPVVDSQQVPTPAAVPNTNNEQEAPVTDPVVPDGNDDGLLDVNEEPMLNLNAPCPIPVMEMIYKPDEPTGVVPVAPTENGDTSAKPVNEAESEAPPVAPVEEVNNVQEPLDVPAQPEPSGSNDVSVEIVVDEGFDMRKLMDALNSEVNGPLNDIENRVAAQPQQTEGGRRAEEGGKWKAVDADAPARILATTVNRNSAATPRLTRERYFELATVPHNGSRCSLSSLEQARDFFASVRSTNYILASEDLPAFVLDGWLEGKKAWRRPEAPSTIIPSIVSTTIEDYKTKNAKALEEQAMKIDVSVDDSKMTIPFGKERREICVKKVEI